MNIPRTFIFLPSKPIASSSRQKYNTQAWHENVLVWAPSPNSQPYCFKLCRAEQSSEGQKSAVFLAVWRRIKSAAVQLTFCVPLGVQGSKCMLTASVWTFSHSHTHTHSMHAAMATLVAFYRWYRRIEGAHFMFTACWNFLTLQTRRPLSLEVRLILAIKADNNTTFFFFLHPNRSFFPSGAHLSVLKLPLFHTVIPKARAVL